MFYDYRRIVLSFVDRLSSASLDSLDFGPQIPLDTSSLEGVTNRLRVILVWQVIEVRSLS